MALDNNVGNPYLFASAKPPSSFFAHFSIPMPGAASKCMSSEMMDLQARTRREMKSLQAPDKNDNFTESQHVHSS